MNELRRAPHDDDARYPNAPAPSFKGTVGANKRASVRTRDTAGQPLDLVSEAPDLARGLSIRSATTEHPEMRTET